MKVLIDTLHVKPKLPDFLTEFFLWHVIIYDKIPLMLVWYQLFVCFKTALVWNVECVVDLLVLRNLPHLTVDKYYGNSFIFKANVMCSQWKSVEHVLIFVVQWYATFSTYNRIIIINKANLIYSETIYRTFKNTFHIFLKYLTIHMREHINTLFKLPHFPSSKYHTTLFKVPNHTLQTTTHPIIKIPHYSLQSTKPHSSKYHITSSK